MSDSIRDDRGYKRPRKRLRAVSSSSCSSDADANTRGMQDEHSQDAGTSARDEATNGTENEKNGDAQEDESGVSEDDDPDQCGTVERKATVSGCCMYVPLRHRDISAELIQTLTRTPQARIGSTQEVMRRETCAYTHKCVRVRICATF